MNIINYLKGPTEGTISSKRSVQKFEEKVSTSSECHSWGLIFQIPATVGLSPDSNKDGCSYWPLERGSRLQDTDGFSPNFQIFHSPPLPPLQNSFESPSSLEMSPGYYATISKQKLKMLKDSQALITGMKKIEEVYIYW